MFKVDGTMLLSSISNGTKPKKAAEEDDPYEGFGIDEVAAPLQTQDLEYDEGFQVIYLLQLV